MEVQTKDPGSKTIVSWRTVFYHGTSIANLELLAVGPPRSAGISSMARRENFGDIVFSGGLRHRSHGRVNLYGGISDTEAYIINIPDPFLNYETLPMKA